MTQFMGTHKNRLDAKGRVSIPAPFRALLKAENASEGASLVLRPSHDYSCIEGWPAATFAALAKPLTRLDPFSQERSDFAVTLFARAAPIEPDKEGRIVLPDDLIASAGLTDTVEFMGLGDIFEIWDPAAAERRRTEARERMGAARTRLAAGSPH